MEWTEPREEATLPAGYEPDLNAAIDDLLARGWMREVTPEKMEEFVNAEGVSVLFFPGQDKQRSDAHDVAVALRELLRDYLPDLPSLRTAIVAREAQAELRERFRVQVYPSLALVLAGQSLEVLPRVLDWSDYRQAFARYLGPPGNVASHASPAPPRESPHD